MSHPSHPTVMNGAAAPALTVIGDRYRVLRKIGEGGMGEVYAAEHVHLEKKVAIKLLRAEVLSNPEAVIRFRQEARSASSIGHDNIIEIDDFGTLPDGRVYMVMEWLHGHTLAELLAAGGLAPARALEILIQTASGLAAAHAKGITHRDMKPENIFVTTTPEGRDVTKILDFGIAKVSAGGVGEAHVTVVGQIFGTPAYMAPEQALGSAMDNRVDVYSMGIILFEVFCGAVPFTSDTFMGILSQHISCAVPPLVQTAQAHGRTLPPVLEPIITRALAKKPEDRYQTMNELGAALVAAYRTAIGPRSSAEHSVPRPRPARRLLWGAIAALGVATGALSVGFMITRTSPKGDTAVPPPPREVPREVPHEAPAPFVMLFNPVIDPPMPPDVPSQPPPDVVPVRVTNVIVSSSPEGAAIFIGGAKVGETPMVIQVKRGEKRQVTLKAKDYKPTTFTLDDSRTKVSRSLELAEIREWDPNNPNQ